MSIQIRKAQSGDTAVVARFNCEMAQETEHLHLDADVVREGVAALVAGRGAGFYLVAEVDGEVAAQLLITYEWSDWRNADFWWIQSVYVDPKHRRKGVFRALYDHVRKTAPEEGACGIRLYVERDNNAARRTYEDLGLKETVYAMYEEDFVIKRDTSHATP